MLFNISSIFFLKLSPSKERKQPSNLRLVYTSDFGARFRSKLVRSSNLGKWASLMRNRTLKSCREGLFQGGGAGLDLGPMCFWSHGNLCSTPSQQSTWSGLDLLDQGSGGPKQGLWGWLVEQEAMHGQRRVLLLVVYIYEGVYECVCLVQVMYQVIGYVSALNRVWRACTAVTVRLGKKIR